MCLLRDPTNKYFWSRLSSYINCHLFRFSYHHDHDHVSEIARADFLPRVNLLVTTQRTTYDPNYYHIQQVSRTHVATTTEEKMRSGGMRAVQVPTQVQVPEIRHLFRGGLPQAELLLFL